MSLSGEQFQTANYGRGERVRKNLLDDERKRRRFEAIEMVVKIVVSALTSVLTVLYLRSAGLV